MTLWAHDQGLVTYGQRFHVLRLRLWKGEGKTVLALAERLDSKYPATIYNIERQWRVPLLPTLMKHAAALGCRPWDLLVDVETEYDLVRQLADIQEAAEADRRWRALFRRYKKATLRVAGQRTTRRAPGESVPKGDGPALAESAIVRDDQTPPLSGASHPVDSRIVARVDGLTRSLEHTEGVARGRGAGGKRPAAARVKKTARRGRARNDRG